MRKTASNSTEDSSARCVGCGACCFGQRFHIRLMPSDLERLERLEGHGAAGLAFDHRDGATFLRMANGHCEHLRITETSLACGIYEARPHVCRDLDEGSPSCLAERLAKYLGHGRLVALRRARTSP
jgi:uncharacterized protein